MKRITIQICIFLCLLGNVKATETFYEYLTEPASLGTSGGVNYYTMIDGEVVPTPTSDLILQYLMGANGGNEASYTLDTSGNNYTGTVSGATWNVATNGLTDYYGFDDSGQYILSPTSLPMTGTTLTEYMIEFWVKPNSNLEDGYWALTKFNNDHGPMYAYGSSAGSIRLVVDTVPASRSITAGIEAGKWQHYIWWWKPSEGGSGDGLRVYKDGVLASTVGILTNDSIVVESLDKFVVGARYSSGFDLDGDIARFKVYTNAPAGTAMASIAISTNRTQAVELGVLSGWLGSDTSRLSRTVANVCCNNNFQDYLGNSSTSADLPALAGTPDIGWGSGNGVAEHLIITASNATNLMFTAGLTASVMTNYAVIDGVQYVNGSAQAFSNVYYESNASSNVFWRVGGSTYYGGLISQIHCGTYTVADAQSLNTYINANIDWTP